MTIITISSVILTTNIIFFLVGKYTERVQWNKLIEKGVLPKPNKRKK